MGEDTGYRPIECDFHDRLEEFAVTRRRVRIAHESGQAPEGLIEDIYTTDTKEEFLRMEDGTTIRLDKIKAVDPAG
jgi:transcriptional antiterminator Rof (Rho-off)